MCGIVGVTCGNCAAEMVQVLDMMVHRGPDGAGTYTDETVTLGHTRLAIIDPENGQQPFYSADSRYVIVYNGEIYNFPELRTQLQARGYSFNSNCDTEVLLYWLVEFGLKGLAKLNGMFAFAFWDSHERQLILARDRLGMKPLYYAHVRGHLLFASEVKAMMPWLPEVRPNLYAIDQYLTYQNVLTDQTFFSDVFKLTGGAWLQWSPNGQATGKFWEVGPSDPEPMDTDRAVVEFSDRLKRSVSRHMVSDVPLGSYLSSGIDSTSVAILASNEASNPMHTFTGAFSGSDYYDERPGARAVAKNIKANLHDIEITPEHYIQNIEDVMWHLEEPALGTGALPHYMVSQLASRDVRVVLTGHAGDELFAGYQVNKAVLLREIAFHQPWRIPGVMAAIRSDEWTRVLYYLLYPLFYPEVKHGLFIMTPRRQRSALLHSDFREATRGVDALNIVDDLLAGRRDHSSGEKLFFLYMTTYLPTLLVQEDKMGMAHSIEARMPLCDNEMIDLAVRLPLQVKLDGGHLKSIPRKAMASILPEKILKSPKRGFPTPFHLWYRTDPLRPYLEDMFSSSSFRNRGIFNDKFVRKEFELNVRSRNDTLMDYARANRLYSFSMVELWFRTFIDKDPISERVPRLATGMFADLLSLKRTVARKGNSPSFNKTY